MAPGVLRKSIFFFEAGEDRQRLQLVVGQPLVAGGLASGQSRRQLREVDGRIGLDVRHRATEAPRASNGGTGDARAVYAACVARSTNADCRRVAGPSPREACGRALKAEVSLQAMAARPTIRRRAGVKLRAASDHSPRRAAHGYAYASSHNPCEASRQQRRAVGVSVRLGCRPGAAGRPVHYRHRLSHHVRRRRELGERAARHPGGDRRPRRRAGRRRQTWRDCATPCSEAGLAIAEREASNDVEVRFAAKAAELAELKYERAMQANRKIVGTVSDLELRGAATGRRSGGVLQFEQAEHRLAVAALRLEEMRATVESLRMSRRLSPGACGPCTSSRAKSCKRARSSPRSSTRTECASRATSSSATWRGLSPQAEVDVRVDGAAVPPELARGVFRGVITFVDVKVEPVSKKVHIAAEVDNRDGLLREGLPAVMLIPRVQATEGHALTATPTR